MLTFLMAVTFVTSSGQKSWEETRRYAESQHEVVLLLIKNKEFSSVLEESRKIFTLKFPVEHQTLLVEGADEISDALSHEGQNELAQQVLDQCMEALESDPLRAAVHKNKAFLFKEMGMDDEAMVHFKKATELLEIP